MSRRGVMELPGESHGDRGLLGLLVGKVSGKLFRRRWREFANLERVMELAFFSKSGKKDGTLKSTGCALVSHEISALCMKVLYFCFSHPTEMSDLAQQLCSPWDGKLQLPCELLLQWLFLYRWIPSYWTAPGAALLPNPPFCLYPAKLVNTQQSQLILEC